MKSKKSTKKTSRKPSLKRSSKFEMRGISKILILVIVAVVLAAGGGLYFMNQKGGGNPMALLAGKTLNPNCEFKDPDLCKFFNNWKEMKNYSMKAISKAGGVTSESTFEMSGKDRSHMVNSENGRENMNYITIGDTTYTKDYSDNKWFKQTLKKEPSGTPVPSQDNPVKVNFDDKKQMEDKTTYKAIGKEACGDLTCFKYQVVPTTDNGTTEYIWFDDREYLLRKNLVTDKSGTTNESTFSYDAVTISVPSPTKEGEPGAGAFPMSESDKKQLEQAQKDAQDLQKTIPQDYSPPADTSGDNPPADQPSDQ